METYATAALQPKTRSMVQSDSTSPEREREIAAASTAIVMGSRLDDELVALLTEAKRLTEADATEMQWAWLVDSFLDRHGADGIVALTIALGRDPKAPRWSMDLLRQFGAPTGDTLLAARRWLFQRFLQHPSPGIRDTALGGLVEIGDGTAVPALSRALQSERVDILRREIERTIAYLR